MLSYSELSMGHARSPLGRLDYRPASIEDASVVVSLMTDDISKWVAAWPFPLSLDQARSILRKICTDADQSLAYPFIASERETGIDIGWVKIAVSDRGEDCWEIGYWIGEEFQGRGLSKDITRFALSFCFNELEADRVFAGAQMGNTISLNLLESMGMRYSHTQMLFAPARERVEECVYKVIDRDSYSP